MNTIQSLAQEMEGKIKKIKKADEREIFVLSGAPEWMSDVIRDVHGSIFPSDTVYGFIWEALASLEDMPQDANEQQAHEHVDENIEADAYTQDLTAWLHADVGHVEYLTRAINDYGARDGFAALHMAQYLHKEDIAHRVIDALAEREASNV